MTEAYQCVRTFGYDLMKQTMNHTNPVLSPVSAYLTLALAGCGAEGETKTEFVTVLGHEMQALAAKIMDTFSINGSCLKLSIANSAWIDPRFCLNTDWENALKSLIKADVFVTELSTDETMNHINQWIAAQTNGLIDQLLTEPLEPRELIRLALFNTIYFKGKWENPFQSYHTHKEAFYLRDAQSDNETKQHKNTIQAEMMRDRTADIEYLSNDFAEGVLLPYMSNQRPHFDFSRRSKGMGFVALKPKRNSSVREICNKLDERVVHELLSGRKPEVADLKLPRFRSEFDIDLCEPLTRIGLTKCFDASKADLSLIGKDTITNDTLYISLVRQKAVLTVDEEGTEAAAATELLGALRAMATPQKQLYFNEPFLYMLLDIEKELPLFIGILDKPSII